MAETVEGRFESRETLIHLVYVTPETTMGMRVSPLLELNAVGEEDNSHLVAVAQHNILDEGSHSVVKIASYSKYVRPQHFM